jgi:hypothetical protein
MFAVCVEQLCPGGGGGYKPLMPITQPTAIQIQPGVPIPTVPSTSQPPMLYGGVCIDVGQSQPGYTELVPHLDGYQINIGVPCPCTDGAKGDKGDPGQQGEQGLPGPQGGGMTPLEPFEGDFPVRDEAGKPMFQRKTVFVPADENGNNCKTLYESIFQMLYLLVYGQTIGPPGGYGQCKSVPEDDVGIA